MIEGYVGRPGSGKSYTLTERVLSEANRGRQVFTNYGVSHPNVWMFEPAQLLDLPPGLVVIDEAHLWFPARMALKLPPSWLAGMSQTRKRGWDLLWSTQHERRVDSVLKDVTSWMHLCSAYFQWGGHPAIFASKCYEPEFFRREKKCMSRRYRTFNPKVAAAYNTHESLAVAEHATSANDAYDKKEKPATTTSRKRNASVLEGVV